jgi:hypothetical protein
MRNKILMCSLFLAGGGFFLSCNKNDNPLPDPCLGVSYDIQYFKTEAVGIANNGTISITSPVGDTLSYQLNSAAFQSSPNFSNLAAGDYRIIVKNQKGCTDTTTITIYNYGPKYALVKQLIAGTGGIGGYCGPCHLDGAVNGGKNFDTDASIVASWDRIKARAVDGNPSFMPQTPNSPLTLADRQKITDWVNAGHRQSD